ncbi:MAG: hypothetical protein ACR2PG_27660 [Hyphomicrobiaceae bacterium]
MNEFHCPTQALVFWTTKALMPSSTILDVSGLSNIFDLKVPGSIASLLLALTHLTVFVFSAL